MLFYIKKKIGICYIKLTLFSGLFFECIDLSLLSKYIKLCPGATRVMTDEYKYKPSVDHLSLVSHPSISSFFNNKC